MNGLYQYQSFPDVPGMVDSYSKLRAMRMPSLVGKSFFDIGCNEGYYCGIALDAGASRVVGLDAFPVAIERARKRFPAAEFILSSWESFLDETFDVILFASAMHYISNEKEMIALLVRALDCLEKDGVLILEAGISEKTGRELIAHQRSDGVVYYPTFEMLAFILGEAGFVWRKVGKSIQADGYQRMVFHCHRVQPTVLFVRGSAGQGKSYLSSSIAGYKDWRVVRIDEILSKTFCKIFPNFTADADNWPGTLQRASLVFSGTNFELLGQLIIDEIFERKSKIKNAGLPLQDPIIVDGLDPNHDIYNKIFSFIVGLLQMDGYRIWDARMLFAPDGGCDDWDTSKKFIDCGGFLLPFDYDAGFGSVSLLRASGDVAQFKVEFRLSESVTVNRIILYSEANGRAHVVRLEDGRASNDVDFSVPLDVLERELGLKLLSSLVPPDDELGRVHFIATTSNFGGFFLNRIVHREWSLPEGMTP